MLSLEWNNFVDIGCKRQQDILSMLYVLHRDHVHYTDHVTTLFGYHDKNYYGRQVSLGLTFGDETLDYAYKKC